MSTIDGIYLDNGATSFPKAPGVGEAMARYINEVGANIGRGIYRSATDAALTVLNTRELLAKLFHFTGPVSHVVFTPGVTYALNQVLRGFLHPGDHVVVSSMEHNAVMRPLMDLTEESVTFSRIPADRDGLTDPRNLIPLLRPETKLVMVSHASNVSGSVFPLEEVAAVCRERDIPLAVDAAQTAGCLPIDFESLGLSALCVPGHKGLLGPQGIGALLMSEKFASQVTPLTTGGTGSASDSERQPAYMPDRFESGTLNLPGIFGLHAALEYVLDRGIDSLQNHSAVMTKRLLEELAGLPVRVVGPHSCDCRVGVVSLDFMGLDNAEAAFQMEQQFGVLTRCGLHCAPNAHKTLGTFPQGTVRLSVGHATTETEIDRAVEAVRSMVEK